MILVVRLAPWAEFVEVETASFDAKEDGVGVDGKFTDEDFMEISMRVFMGFNGSWMGMSWDLVGFDVFSWDLMEFHWIWMEAHEDFSWDLMIWSLTMGRMVMFMGFNGI